FEKKWRFDFPWKELQEKLYNTREKLGLDEKDVEFAVDLGKCPKCLVCTFKRNSCVSANVYQHIRLANEQAIRHHYVNVTVSTLSDAQSATASDSSSSSTSSLESDDDSTSYAKADSRNKFTKIIVNFMFDRFWHCPQTLELVDDDNIEDQSTTNQEAMVGSQTGGDVPLIAEDQSPDTECPDDFEAFDDSEETGEDAPADINPSQAAVETQDGIPFDEAPTNTDLKLQLLTKVALLLLQKIGDIKFVAALGRDASTALDVQGKKKTITVDGVRIKVGYVPHPGKLLYDMTTFTRWCKRQEEWDSGVEHPKQWG
ncbi:hypothetical protein HDV05_003235, partial [Chytridiales sp. JEL 0842]